VQTSLDQTVEHTQYNDC